MLAWPGHERNRIGKAVLAAGSGIMPQPCQGRSRRGQLEGVATRQTLSSLASYVLLQASRSLWYPSLAPGFAADPQVPPLQTSPTIRVWVGFETLKKTANCTRSGRTQHHTTAVLLPDHAAAPGPGAVAHAAGAARWRCCTLQCCSSWLNTLVMCPHNSHQLPQLESKDRSDGGIQAKVA